MNELIVHVGPPKTASTLLQMSLFTASEFLERNGILYFHDRHSIACHSLVNALMGSTSWFPDGWLEEHETRRDEHLLSVGTGFDRVILSCEDFADLQKDGIRRLIEMVQPEQLTVVYMAREPGRWLWSVWQQQCKTFQCSPWTEFLDAAMSNDLFSLSELVEKWSDVPVPVRFMIMPIESRLENGPLGPLLQSLGVDVGSLPRFNPFAVNESMTVGETLLTTMLAREVQDELNIRQSALWGRVNAGRASRIFFDLVDRSRPMYELGRVMEGEVRSRADSPLSLDSLDQVSMFTEQWHRSCESVLNRSDVQVIGSGETSIEELHRRWAGFDLPFGMGLPRYVFEEFIELPSQVMATARLIAASIGRDHRVTSIAKRS